MLGRMPLVSMSDSRLGGMENSSLRYLSATRALEFSTSRMVRPSFSRSVRRLFPAGSMGAPPKKVGESYQRRGHFDVGFVQKFQCDWVVTKSEHTLTLVRRGKT